MMENAYFERVMGHRFQNEALITEAITHSSYVNERREPGCACNERLEFLGDSVLGIIISDYLFQNFPQWAEGNMTKARASIVCEGALAAAARKIDLGSVLLLGKGEESSGGADRDSVLADATEAVIAALYLDAGYTITRDWVLSLLHEFIEEAATGKAYKDYKTILQEHFQSKNTARLSYALLSESGPEHDKRFETEVRLGRRSLGRGSGHSKKEAEQAAAQDALKHL